MKLAAPAVVGLPSLVVDGIRFAPLCQVCSHLSRYQKRYTFARIFLGRLS